MPAPLLSMYNGGAGRGAVARFRRNLPATPAPGVAVSIKRLNS
jgi:hypothetical protein